MNHDVKNIEFGFFDAAPSFREKKCKLRHNSHNTGPLRGQRPTPPNRHPPPLMTTMADVKISIDDSPIDVLCLACDSGKCDFSVQRMQRRSMRPDDVVIDMKYCGVCHSDLHQAAGHMVGILGKVEYPMVPGHELAGIVKAVGSAVTKFKVGDQIGVGCMVDSCGACKMCADGEEQKCKKGQIGGAVHVASP